MTTMIDWEVTECRPDETDEDWKPRTWNTKAPTQHDARKLAAQGLGLSRDLLVANPVLWVVSVHLVDRAYGGPEEGGWWYDYGMPLTAWDWIELVQDHKLDAAFLGPFIVGNHADACEVASRINRRLDETVNKDRPPIYSTQSCGMFRAIVQQGMAPHPWPADTPRYE